MKLRKFNRCCLGMLFFVVAGCGTRSMEPSRPAVVIGASMYPAFRGEQFELDCDQCRFHFEFDASRVPRSGLAVCPNCGFAHNDFSDQIAAPPPELKLMPVGKGIFRWDVIAFSIDDKLAIKRVIGLPGESIAIRAGNIYCNGILLTKPVEVQQQMLIPVFDSAFLPARDSTRRMAFSEEDEDGWRTYHPIRGYRHSSSAVEPAAIEDSYGYNQNLARNLNRVDEVCVVVSGKPGHGIDSGIRLFAGQQRIEIAAHQERRQIEVQINADESETVEVTDAQLESSNSLAVSNCDGRLRVFHNGRLLLERTLPIASQAETTTELAIQVRGTAGAVGCNRVQIFRDVYFLNSTTSQSESQSRWPVPRDEYFVLGDNAPVSVDSRSHGPIRSADVVGKVFPGPQKNGMHTD